MQKAVYKKFGFETLQDLKNFLDQGHIRELIGENDDHYRELWVADYDRVMNGAGRRKVAGSFNWMAMLSFPVWLGYRKMYLMYWVITLMLATVTFAEIYFSWNLPHGAFLGMNIALALMSKDLYFQHLYALDKKIAAAPNAERKNKIIKMNGGTSITLAVLALPVFLVVQVAAIYAASLLVGGAEVSIVQFDSY